MPSLGRPLQVTERDGRIDPRRFERWHATGHERDDGQRSRDGDECLRICRLNFVKELDIARVKASAPATPTAIPASQCPSPGGPLRRAARQ